MTPQQEWNAREELRAQWDAFFKSEAGKLGLEVLEKSRTPHSSNEEPPAVKIARLDRLSGFHECIKMLRMLPTAGNKKETVLPSEWAHITNQDQHE